MSMADWFQSRLSDEQTRDILRALIREGYITASMHPTQEGVTLGFTMQGLINKALRDDSNGSPVPMTDALDKLDAVLTERGDDEEARMASVLLFALFFDSCGQQREARIKFGRRVAGQAR